MKKNKFLFLKKFKNLAVSLAVLISILSFSKALEINFPDSLLANFSYIYANSNVAKFTGIQKGFSIVFISGDKKLDDSRKIEISTGKYVYCSKQIQGLYLNPVIGNFLLPLDDDSLYALKGISSSYSGLQLDGGLFFDCEGYGENYVFGQVSWKLATGITYKLTAGVAVQSGQLTGDFDSKTIYYKPRIRGNIYDSVYGLGVLSGEIVDTEVDDFFIPMIKDADLDTYYRSDPVEVKGLGMGVKVLAKINSGVDAVLFINGTGMGSSGYVQNGDKIEIEMKSSKKYNDITSVTLRIGQKYSVFYIKTKKNGTVDSSSHELTNSDKLWLSTLFSQLVKNYVGGETKLMLFLYTFKKVLDDKLVGLDQNTRDYAVLDYFRTLITSYLMGGSQSDTSSDNSSNIDISTEISSNHGRYIETYTAPNCKKYVIMYDNSRKLYYSPDFIYQYYFISLDAIEKYIEKNNPGKGYCDGVVDYREVNRVGNTSPDIRIAPNGKQYRIVKTINGKYTSPDFIYPRYFDSLQAIRRYIDYHNPAFTTRDHIVDPKFIPVVHIAPNCKTYKIIKTNRGYTSYDFLKPKYFPTWDAIVQHIDNRNPGNCPISPDEQDQPINGSSHNSDSLDGNFDDGTGNSSLGDDDNSGNGVTGNIESYLDGSGDIIDYLQDFDNF